MEADCFFDARTCFEDGLHLCSGKDAPHDLKVLLSGRIETANYKLAERNLNEAESAFSRGETTKAIDHLELVKTLTHDHELREKAEKLLLSFSLPEDDNAVLITPSSCSSCAGSAAGECGDTPHSESSLPLSEYYELLIQQLPPDQYQRYTGLGEKFAVAYSAASRDEHQEAFEALDNCANSLPEDIYLYERGKVLHRLGNDGEAEQDFRAAIGLNRANSLPWLALALLLRENNRFDDAAITVETMVAEQIMPEQALLLRADIFEATGDHEAAVHSYVELLQTPYAHAAAEKLYGLLLDMGRQSDAAVILKKYLNKSCH